MLNNELKNRNLPCLLTLSNGEKVTDIASWEIRRAEILESLQTEMYGRLPQKPKSIKFEEISNDDFFCAGKANLKKIMITCELENGTFSFPVSYTPVVAHDSKLGSIQDARKHIKSLSQTKRIAYHHLLGYVHLWDVYGVISFKRGEELLRMAYGILSETDASVKAEGRDYL